jgi:diadenosine tetraphosphate (Ap4A) HIT family hydrolase
LSSSKAAKNLKEVQQAEQEYQAAIQRMVSFRPQWEKTLTTVYDVRIRVSLNIESNKSNMIPSLSFHFIFFHSSLFVLTFFNCEILFSQPQRFILTL